MHIADKSGALLVDYSYGLGRVVILSDPYIVTNGGIKLNDNLQLAINTIAGRDGVIAFDEYHQGRGVTENAFAAYFAGTPVLALAAQIAPFGAADSMDQCAPVRTSFAVATSRSAFESGVCCFDG